MFSGFLKCHIYTLGLFFEQKVGFSIVIFVIKLKFSSGELQMSPGNGFET
jgi:hypothetical protein